MPVDRLAARAPSLEDFERLMAEAFASLPATVRRACADLALRVEDFAPDEVLDEMGIEDPYELTGLYDGIALTGLGDHEGAEKRFRRALEIEPGFAAARLYLGNALLRQGRASEAADAYLVFLSLDPSSNRAERVRRVLQKIAPERAPAPPALPVAPTPAPVQPPEKTS